MSITHEHVGPWTADDVLALGDDGTHNRYEVIDGSLLVTPAPSFEHQRASVRLVTLLQDAGDAAGAEVEVIECVNLRLPGGGLNIPDLLVIDSTVLGPTPIELAPAHVLAVVEIVSPSSRRVDRVLKPSVYADAGIPTFWRVELEPEPVIVVSTLVDGVYRVDATATAGSTTTLPSPFPVTFDPGQLIGTR
jgi:Uma2 family endonuclease